MIATSTGVYGDTEETFFSKLVNQNIDVFIDIRQRRGVRGSKYKFVNSTYLQNKLKELGIEYQYIKDLAPTYKIREQQKADDIKNHTTKSLRTCLGHQFITIYQTEILYPFDFTPLIAEMTGKKVIFFCVEEHHSACHRSLVLEHLEKLGINCYHF